MVKNTINMTILAIIAYLFACEYEDKSYHYTIKFVNNDEKPIYLNFGFEYPDTIVGVPAPTYWQNKINHGETNTYALSMRTPWENIFKNKTRIPSDTLMVFVFDTNKLDSLFKEDPRGSVFDALVKRYDLSLDDIRRMNWILYYPPTKAMKGIKMHPPYGI